MPPNTCRNVKSRNNFLISQPKHKLWIFTISTLFAGFRSTGGTGGQTPPPHPHFQVLYQLFIYLQQGTRYGQINETVLLSINPQSKQCWSCFTWNLNRCEPKFYPRGAICKYNIYIIRYRKQKISKNNSYITYIYEDNHDTISNKSSDFLLLKSLLYNAYILLLLCCSVSIYLLYK